MARHNELGKWGEKLAVEHLVSEGYAIVETNWHMGHYELDIIAMTGDRIVFVEVKTRSSDTVDPLISIDRRRIRRMVVAANAYIVSYNIPHEYRFDVITVVGSPSAPEPPRIEHIVDAFLPPLHTFR